MNENAEIIKTAVIGKITETVKNGDFNESDNIPAIYENADITEASKKTKDAEFAKVGRNAEIDIVAEIVRISEIFKNVVFDVFAQIAKEIRFFEVAELAEITEKAKIVANCHVSEIADFAEVV